MPLEGDIALVAAWKSLETPVTYTVRHVSADGTVLAERIFKGLVGQTVSAFALNEGSALRQGYAYVDKAGEAIDLAADVARNVIVFTYANDPRHPYAVHLRDATTGRSVAADIDFNTVEALLNFRAPAIPGYQVIHGGQGYLTTREGGQELTFWYAMDAEPPAPGELSEHGGNGVAPTGAAAAPMAGEGVASAPVAPEARHAAKALPATGDDMDARVPTGLATVAAATAALGFGVRRRAKHAR